LNFKDNGALLVLAAIRSSLAQSDFFAFNVRNRDIWLAEQVKQIPAGAKVLDVGAGSAPYRPLFAHW
jgi:hypothetical protein